MAVTRKCTFFANSVHTKDMSHNEENMLEMVKDEITRLGGFTKIVGLCTDNTACNRAIWGRLERERPDFFAYGCVCHALHLLVKDMVDTLPWLRTLFDNILVIIKCFKNSHLLWSLLRDLQHAGGLRALALPGLTRWASFLAAVVTLLASYDILSEIVKETRLKKIKLILTISRPKERHIRVVLQVNKMLFEDLLIDIDFFESVDSKTFGPLSVLFSFPPCTFFAKCGNQVFQLLQVLRP